MHPLGLLQLRCNGWRIYGQVFGSSSPSRCLSCWSLSAGLLERPLGHGPESSVLKRGRTDKEEFHFGVCRNFLWYDTCTQFTCLLSLMLHSCWKYYRTAFLFRRPGTSLQSRNRCHAMLLRSHGSHGLFVLRAVLFGKQAAGPRVWKS